MSTIFSNVGGDLKNYRLQVIDSWVDGESPKLMDNPVDGDMISFRSMVDGVPTVTATKVYSNGSWVDAGGGGGETPTVLYDGDVLLEDLYGTISSDNYSLSVTFETLPDTVTVVWDGVEYADLTKDEYNYYGAPYDGEAFDFSEYPFAVAMFDSGGGLNDTIAFWGGEEGTYSATVSAIVSGGGGGGGGGITTESLYVTENGDYYADEGTAYDYVNVDTPAMPSLTKITITNSTGQQIYCYGYDANLAEKEVKMSANGSYDFYVPLYEYCSLSPLFLYTAVAVNPLPSLSISYSGTDYAYLLRTSDNKGSAVIVDRPTGNVAITITAT